jgi:hypothetical protein
MWRHAVAYTGGSERDGRAGVVVIAPLLMTLSGVAAQGLLDDMLAELRRVSADNPALVYGVAGLFGVSLLLGLVSLASGLALRRSVRAGAAQQPAADLVAPPPAPTPPTPEAVPAQPVEATISEPLPSGWEDRSEDETSIGGRAVAADQEQPEAPFAPTQPIEAATAEPVADAWEDRSEDETSIGERTVAADQEQPEAPFAPAQPVEAATAEPVADAWEDRSEDETSVGERTVAADQEQPEAPFAPAQPVEAATAEPVADAWEDRSEDETSVGERTVAPDQEQPVEAAVAEPVTDDTRPTPVGVETPPVGPPIPQPITSDEEPTAWDEEAVETAHLGTDELEEADTELLAAVEAARIYLVGLDQPSLRFMLEPGGGRLGSAPECECIIEAPAVSPYHAAIWRSGQTWLVRDLGSSEGTFVNDERVTGDRPLQDKDVLRVGSVRFSIEF